MSKKLKKLLEEKIENEIGISPKNLNKYNIRILEKMMFIKDDTWLREDSNYYHRFSQYPDSDLSFRKLKQAQEDYNNS